MWLKRNINREEPMAYWLNETELNSVKYLNKIRKAVYLMESTLEPGSYRFGGISAMSGQANSPIWETWTMYKR